MTPCGQGLGVEVVWLCLSSLKEICGLETNRYAVLVVVSLAEEVFKESLYNLKGGRGKKSHWIKYEPVEDSFLFIIIFFCLLFFFQHVAGYYSFYLEG